MSANTFQYEGYQSLGECTDPGDGKVMSADDRLISVFAISGGTTRTMASPRRPGQLLMILPSISSSITVTFTGGLVGTTDSTALYTVENTAQTYISMPKYSGTGYEWARIAFPDLLDVLYSKTIVSPTITTPTLTLTVQALAAAGTNQATAGAITAASGAFIVVSGADATKAVVLPAAAAGKIYHVKNNAAATLKLFPASGDAINAIAADTEIVMASLVAATFIAVDATTWMTFSLLPS